ncbi:MAG: hypothetical protein Fur0043_07850 [Anaerolineales bacterium]
MSHIQKILSIFTLTALLALFLAVPAHAFEERSGEKIIIAADEVVEDDLYLFAAEVVVEGTVKGDLIAFGSQITVNGTIEGDLISAGQVVVINGVVKDDVRIAGAGLQVGENAQIDDDLLAAGASLEVKPGSVVGGDVVVGAAQALLAGNVKGDVLAGTGALELAGTFGGNVKAYVDQTEETANEPSPNIYMQQNIPIALPSLAPGLTVKEGAKIAGDLEYSSTYDLQFPSGVVGGKVNRVEPKVDEHAYTPPTPAQQVGKWALNLLRSIVTLVLFSLLLIWLAPLFLQMMAGKMQSHLWPSLGWGAIAWAAFFFAMLVILVVMIVGGMIFGTLTLGSISGVILWVGILALFALTVAFILATAYLTKIVVGTALGKWVLGRFSLDLAEHKFWPTVIGVTIVALVVGLFKFPLLPLGFLGWLINFAVILFGLGALWLWGRERFRMQPAG